MEGRHIGASDPSSHAWWRLSTRLLQLVSRGGAEVSNREASGQGGKNGDVVGNSKTRRCLQSILVEVEWNGVSGVAPADRLSFGFIRHQQHPLPRPGEYNTIYNYRVHITGSVSPYC